MSQFLNMSIMYVFENASQGRITSRNNYARLKVLFRKLTWGRKDLEQIVKFNEKKHLLKHAQA